MSTGQFGDACPPDFRIISCKGGWLLDQTLSLICIYTHMNGPVGSHPDTSLSGQRFWYFQQALSRWGVALCLHPHIW